MRTHAFCMRTHTQSMRTHTIGLRMQPYVCISIFMHRNPNLNLWLLFLYFICLICLCPSLFSCLYVSASMFVCLGCSLHARLGFYLSILLFCHEYAYDMTIH